MIEKIEALMKYETAGDPISGLLWTRKTREKISDELAKIDIRVGATTVGNILKKLNYSLKCNSKKVSNGGRKLTKEENERCAIQIYSENTIRVCREKAAGHQRRHKKEGTDRQFQESWRSI